MSNKPFNDSSYEQFLNEERIMGSKCKNCGDMAFPPRPICIACFGCDMEWVQFKGTGHLVAFTSIVVVPPFMAKEGFNRNNPYLVGVAELDEGVKVVARLIGLDAKKPEQIRVGTRLAADFLRREGGAQTQTTLVFKPI